MIPKGFTVAHINIRSLRHKIDEFSILLNRTEYDVLTVSEMWLDESTESTLLMVESFNLFRSDRSRIGRTGSKKGGGLAMFIRSECVSDPFKYDYLNRCNEFIEVQVITVKKGNDRDSVIMNVYRPPSGNVDSFVEELVQITEVACNERYKDVTLLGDFNMDHLATKRTKCYLALVLSSILNNQQE